MPASKALASNQNIYDYMICRLASSFKNVASNQIFDLPAKEPADEPAAIIRNLGGGGGEGGREEEEGGDHDDDEICG